MCVCVCVCVREGEREREERERELAFLPEVERNVVNEDPLVVDAAIKNGLVPQRREAAKVLVNEVEGACSHEMHEDKVNPENGGAIAHVCEGEAIENRAREVGGVPGLLG